MSDLGELVRPRGRAVNQCEYCAGLAALENCEMLMLDALDGDAPEVLMVLGTRTATLEREPFYNGRRLVVRALRRRWPALEYASLLEYTTGYAERSGGERRPHWNLPLKGVTVDDVEEIRALAVPVWCRHVDAEAAAQHVGSIYAAGGLMKYLTSHFQKGSQRPPAGFGGQRFNCSRGYFGRATRATARARARDSMRLNREVYKAERAGFEGAAALERAHAEHRENLRRVWTFCDAHGCRRGPTAYHAKKMRLTQDRGARGPVRFCSAQERRVRRGGQFRLWDRWRTVINQKE